MVERKLEWPLNLSNELKKWIPEHGYTAATQLADELEIPKRFWTHIYQGNNIVMSGREDKFDGRFFYARINLWTDLEESDPRTIPDRLIRLPNGNMVNKKRNFSEDEYQEWLKSPEAQELLAKKHDRFKRKIIIESTNQQQASKQAEISETVGSFIGSVIDGVINRGANQIARVVLENQQQNLVLPQISELIERITTIESIIARLAQSEADQTTPRSRIRNSSDIRQASIHIRNLLETYKLGTSDDRDKLMQTYGRDLIALDMVVHTLTRRQHEREEIIKLTEETRL